MTIFPETSARADLRLPHRLFLISLRPEKGRLDDDSAAVRGSLLVAAALAELCITGRLRDRGGRAERTNDPAPFDPFLARVLADVPADRPRRWFDLMEARSYDADKVVRDQLVAEGLVTLEQRRILGPFTTNRLHAADLEAVEALRSQVRDVVRRDPAADPMPIGDAVLAMLAIDGNVSTVFKWGDLRGRKPVIRAVNGRIDRDLPGLRPALIGSIAAKRSPA